MLETTDTEDVCRFSRNVGMQAIRKLILSIYWSIGNIFAFNFVVFLWLSYLSNIINQYAKHGDLTNIILS